MSIADITKENKISKAEISKRSGIPYMTVSDLMSGKTDPMACSARTIYLLAKAMGVTMEELVEPLAEPDLP